MPSTGSNRRGSRFEVVKAADFDSVAGELAEVSARWLQARKGQEKGFSLGSFNPDYLRRFDTAVLRKDGRIVAFANLWRSAGQEELSADLMRFDANVSRVLMDGLFVAHDALRPLAGLCLFQPRRRAPRRPRRPSARIDLGAARHLHLPSRRQLLPFRGTARLQAEVRSGLDAAISRLPARAGDPAGAARRRPPHFRASDAAPDVPAPKAAARQRETEPTR